MEQKPLGPIRLDLAEAQADPALSVIFDAARRSGSVVTEIAAGSLDDLKLGRITVQVRGL